MEFIFIIFLIAISFLAIDAVIYFVAGFFRIFGLYGSGIGFDSFSFYDKDKNV